MIRDNYGHAKRRSRHVLYTACFVQVEFVSPRTVQHEHTTAPRKPSSPGVCSPSGTTCKDPPSFPDTANLLTVKTNGSLRQVQGRHGASFACEWDGVSLGLSLSAKEPAASTDAFAVVGTDFRRRESFGRQIIGICLLHRGLSGVSGPPPRSCYWSRCRCNAVAFGIPSDSGRDLGKENGVTVMMYIH